MYMYTHNNYVHVHVCVFILTRTCTCYYVMYTTGVSYGVHSMHYTSLHTCTYIITCTCTYMYVHVHVHAQYFMNTSSVYTYVHTCHMYTNRSVYSLCIVPVMIQAQLCLSRNAEYWGRYVLPSQSLDWALEIHVHVPLLLSLSSKHIHVHVNQTSNVHEINNICYIFVLYQGKS